MTRSSKHVAIAAGIALAVSATAVFATHNAPAKAKGLKITLVNAYNACPSPPGNDSQGTTPPLPACHPPVPTTNTNTTHKVGFGIKGGASVQVAVGTGDLKLKVK